MSLSRRLRNRGITLDAPEAKGTYAVAKRVGSLVFVSGQGSQLAGRLLTGTVGTDIDLFDARQGSRELAVQLLAAAASVVSNVDDILGVVSLQVFVRSEAGFDAHIAVADGCSDFFEDVFGSSQLPARAAVGVSSLPFGLAVEATAIFELGASS